MPDVTTLAGNYYVNRVNIVLGSEKRKKKVRKGREWNGVLIRRRTTTMKVRE